MTLASTLDVHTFLDRRPIGRQQWTVIVLGLLILVLDGFDTMIMGFVAPALIQDWGLERSVLGPLMMSGLVGLSLGSLCAGPLADRFGRRRVIIGSVAFFGVCCLASAFVDSLTQLTVVRLLTGVGLGATMPNITTLLSECAPHRRRSHLVTSAWCGFAIGGALGGLLSQHLIEAFGWRSVFVAGGVLPLLLVLALLRWLPESLRYLMLRGRPQSVLVAAVNRLAPGIATLQTRFISSEEVPDSAGSSGPLALLRRPYRTGTLMIWLAMFMGFLSLYLLSNWLPLAARSAGLSLAQAAMLGALLQLGGAFGDFTVGLKMDRFGPDRIVGLMLAAATVIALCLAHWSGTVSSLGVLIFALGYVLMSANAGCFALGTGHYPTVIRATGVSWVFGIGRLGAILGAGLGAVMMKLDWSIAQIFLFLAAPLALGTLAIACKWMAGRRAAGLSEAGG